MAAGWASLLYLREWKNRHLQSGCDVVGMIIAGSGSLVWWSFSKRGSGITELPQETNVGKKDILRVYLIEKRVIKEH